jgi:signal transduction histidine kinase
LIASLSDITERLAAEAKLELTRAQLRALTEKLMTQERRLVQRMALTLHDHLGQTIAAIGMAHETLLALRGEQRPAGVDQLHAQMGTLIGQAVRQVRQVLGELRPPLLEEQGLLAALDNELRNRSLAQPAVDISIHVPNAMAQQRWPGEVEYAAFMVAREAIENTFRHAAASHVAVRLAGTALALELSVLDNGIGITPAAVPPTGRLGIYGMHERAQAVGATVTLESDPASGTRVVFNWQGAP